MTLSAAQIANTLTPTFDVGLRFFSYGAPFAELDLTGFSRHSSAPVTYWHELTNVAFEGSFTHDWTGSAITWSAQLRGWAYDAEFLAPGFAIACMYRITREGYDSLWLLDWVGVIDSNAQQDDYQHGAPWSLTVRSAEAALLTTDSPHLILGAENVAEDGASVDASSTLATPEAEAGLGEFVGTTVTLDPAFVVDDDMRTLWISQYPPRLVGEEKSTSVSAFTIDEVFTWPLAGYNPSDVWWMEIIYQGSLSSPDLTGGNNFWIWARNADGDDVVYMPSRITPNAGVSVRPGERFILCGNEARAAAYVGSFNGAAQVIELKGIKCFAPPTRDDEGDLFWDGVERPFTLHPTDGYIIFGKYTSTNYDAIFWGDPPMPAYYDENTGWLGGGVTPPVADSGWSIRRKGGNFDSNTAADWQLAAYPRPGDKWNADAPAWLKLELREHETLLSAAVDVAATTLPLSSSYGWPATGTGIIEGDTFSYTVSGNDLLLDAGIAHAHVIGAALWPTVGGELQTGWLVNRVVLKRPPGLPSMAVGRCYLSHNPDCMTPDLEDIGDLTWLTDYDWNAAYNSNSNGNPEAEVVFTVYPETWTRSVLLIWDYVTYGYRAKLNEVEVIIDPGWTADGLAFGTVYHVLRYLLATSGATQAAAALAVAYEAPWGLVGKLATAIAPLPIVMADIAGVHGCVLDWGRDGKPLLHSDPWWPMGRGSHSDTGGSTYGSVYTFDAASLRGEISYSESRPAIMGVAVTARDASGNLLERIVFPPGATGSTVQELTGLTLSSAGQTLAAAANLYFKANNTQRATALVTGVGEWCEPLQIITLDKAGQYQYIIERVTRSWGGQANAKTWRCELALRKYFA